MKRKDRIYKQDGSWVLSRPPFGFAQTPVETPCRTHTEAIKRSAERGTGYASVERASDPENLGEYQTDFWPVIVR